jgi:hypothetical protein
MCEITEQPFGVREKRGVEDVGPALDGPRGEAVVHVAGRAEAKRAVVMVVIVPVEEGASLSIA